MNANTKRVVTRFAPSPTGFMHVGGVRTALYAWAYARKNNGSFILRIEDTDKKREVEGSIAHIISSLKWLKIDWNEGPDIGGPHGPYLQSERLESYRKYAQILIDKGLAYADPYTEEQLEEFRKKAEIEKRPFLYRDHRPENPPAWDGTKALRFKTPVIKSYEWNDLVRGSLHAGEEALDDFILIKSDGYPTYNFAHIIDDLEMEVTHIFRADEFISSVPKFLSFYEALEIERPEFVTLPPILGKDGNKKLGKRDGAKDILEYKSEGYLPEAMVNFLSLIGWNPGGDREIFSTQEFIELFDIEKIQVAGGRFNDEKLKWTNREHLKKKHEEEIIPQVVDCIKKADRFKEKEWSVDVDIVRHILKTLLERISVYTDIVDSINSGEWDYIFENPEYDLLNLKWKKSSKTNEEIGSMLEELKETLDTIDENTFNPETIRERITPLMEKYGNGDILWPMRYALTGKEKSPDPFEVATMIGKDRTIERIDIAIKHLRSH